MSPASKRRRRLVRAAKVLLALALVLGVLKTWVVEIGRVRLHSLEPTLCDGDWVVFEKISARRPKRFDIVVFKAPREPDKVYIKRVIGLPNEVVEVRLGKLFVNELEVCLPNGANWAGADFGPTPVERAHYFVVGDNPANSVDSREWGGVPRDYVLGRVILRFRPVGKWKTFRRESALTRE
ncbi:MAG: signal peptidase I [Planctomycetes bacterium]|nr:signal peptidase I [Planctomycetota bacterium]